MGYIETLQDPANKDFSKEQIRKSYFDAKLKEQVHRQEDIDYESSWRDFNKYADEQESKLTVKNINKDVYDPFKSETAKETAQSLDEIKSQDKKYQPSGLGIADVGQNIADIVTPISVSTAIREGRAGNLRPDVKDVEYFKDVFTDVDRVTGEKLIPEEEEMGRLGKAAQNIGKGLVMDVGLAAGGALAGKGASKVIKGIKSLKKEGEKIAETAIKSIEKPVEKSIKEISEMPEQSFLQWSDYSGYRETPKPDKQGFIKIYKAERKPFDTGDSISFSPEAKSGMEKKVKWTEVVDDEGVYKYIPDVKPARPERARNKGIQKILDSEEMSMLADEAKIAEEKGMSFWDRIKRRYKDTMTESFKDTEAGQIIANKVRFVEDTSEIQTGHMLEDLRMLFRNASRPEKENWKNVLRGIEKPMNDKVAQAARLARSATEDIRGMAEKSGLTILNREVQDWTIKQGADEMGGKVWLLKDQYGKTIDSFFRKKDAQIAKNAYMKSPWEGIENYFPLEVDIRKLDSNIDRASLEIAQRKFLESGKAITPTNMTELRKIAEQEKVVLKKFIKDNMERRYGHLQYSRELDLPEWAYSKEDPLDMFERYIYKSNKRLSEAMAFGSRDEKLKDLYQAVAKQGGDREFVETMMNRYIGSDVADKDLNMIVRGLTSAQVMMKMGLSQVGQFGQVVNSVVFNGFMNTTKGVWKYLSNYEDAYRLFVRSGSYASHIRGDALKIMGGGRAAEWYLNTTQFTRTDRWSRYIANQSGAIHAREMLEILAKKPNSNAGRHALRKLQDHMGVPFSKIEQYLTTGEGLNDIMSSAAFQAEKRTNFRSGIANLPPGWTTPSGKVMFQFLTFIYHQGGFIKKYAVDEAIKHGRIKPLALLLTSGGVAGEAVRDVRSVIQGRYDRLPWNEERDPKSISKRYLEDLAQVGAFGLADVFMSAIKYGYMPGATFSTLFAYSKGAGEAMSGRYTMILRQLVGDVPFAGQALKYRIVPTKEQKDKMNPKSSIGGIGELRGLSEIKGL